MGLDNPLHIAIVLVVVLMVFGAKKLPEMGRGLGEGMRGFKSGLTGEHPQPETKVPETTVQQLSAAPAQPVATATSAEERTAEPIA